MVYDIRDDKKRKRILKLMKGYGKWQQYSVFECELNRTKLNEMITRIKKIIDERNDSVLIYNLCVTCAAQTILIGTAQPYEEEEIIVV